jgi:GTP-binding protein SAR1
MLRDNKLIAHEPTRHPQFEELTIGNVKFKTHDLGGHIAARRIWQTYFASVNGVVFLVDTTDHARFPEARQELNSLLSDESLNGVPFLILGNKIDHKSAVREEVLKEQLGIMTTGKQNTSRSAVGDRQPIELFMCSVVKRAGYPEGFRWLSNFL